MDQFTVVTLSPDDAMEKLRAVIRDSQRILSYGWMDESAFFVATAHVKQSTVNFLPETLHDEVSVAFINSVDEMEQLVESGLCHFMGKVLVPYENLQLKLQALEIGMAHARQSASTSKTANLSSPEHVLAQARREAAEIVAAAHEEAASTRAGNAGQSGAGSPWSS